LHARFGADLEIFSFALPFVFLFIFPFFLRVTVVFYYVLFKIHAHTCISFVILRCRRGSNIHKAAGDNNKNNKKQAEINKK